MWVLHNCNESWAFLKALTTTETPHWKCALCADIVCGQEITGDYRKNDLIHPSVLHCVHRFHFHLRALNNKLHFAHGLGKHTRCSLLVRVFALPENDATIKVINYRWIRCTQAIQSIKLAATKWTPKCAGVDICPSHILLKFSLKMCLLCHAGCHAVFLMNYTHTDRYTILVGKAWWRPTHNYKFW